MRVLVIGGSGLLGSKLVDILIDNNFEVYATYFKTQIKKKNFFQLNITNGKKVNKIFEKIRPEIVFHTAAYTNVDKCEIKKDTAFFINVKGTRNIAKSSKKYGSNLIFISTDYVFDGLKGNYNEEDSTNPIDYYGLTKQQGENIVKKICSNFIIARTSVIYGANKNNFITWIISNLQKGKKISIVKDQFNSPTYNINLSEQLITLIKNNLQGVFHAAGSERINRYDFALKVAEIFNLNANLIEPSTIDNMSWIAKRPKDSSLCTLKISNFIKPYKVTEALELLRKEMGF